MPDILSLEERLAEIRMRGYHRGETGDIANRLSDCAAIDIPRLLAAVEAALEFHRPLTTANGILVCPMCSRAAGMSVRAPCDERQAISAALLGKDPAGG